MHIWDTQIYKDINMSSDSDKSLYERIGGDDAVSATVDLFYKKVLADDRIKHFFEDTDMEKQRRHQTRFKWRRTIQRHR